jgi:GT2 family glycosyltransferase
MNQPNVGIVVPTMGMRPEFLRQSLASIRLAGKATIHIVAPESAKLTSVLDQGSYDALIIDPGTGLSAAIDAGLRSFPPNIEFMNWLGDDDLLTEGSLNYALAVLEGDPESVLVYGGCEYIDGDGRSLWLNKSGSYAKYVMRCGPQLIPQPGALFRRDAYERIGGLKHQYKWAFDLDLLIRISSEGKLRFANRTLAKFRWHQGSLSVGGRKGSVSEASMIRTAALPFVLRTIAPIWELPIRKAILRAGKQLNQRSTQP